MDLSRVISSTANTGASVYAASVSRVSNDDIYVTIPDKSSTYEYGPAILAAGRNDTVALSDACVVVLDPTNRVYITSWGAPPAAFPPPFVTSLPASPTDGQEVVYVANATDGVSWHLKYRAADASSYKWNFIGGADLVSGPSGSITTTSGTPVALTNGPSITLPLGGDYLVDWIADGQAQANGLAQPTITYAVNGSAQADQAFIVSQVGYDGATLSRRRRKTSLAANAVLSIMVSTANSISTSFNNGTLIVRPVRVG